MLARWSITYGPEFAACREEWRGRTSRFDLHLASIKIALERDPYRYSTAFASPEQRVIESDDFKDGFTMTAYIHVDRDRLDAKIMWVELRSVREDGDDDELSDEAN